MKKLICILPVILLATVSFASAEQTVHLQCKTDIAEKPSSDPNVKETYDVYVRFLDDGAILTVDGSEYELTQEYDAPVAFYRFEPWYNLQIGNRNYTTKYALGIPTKEDFARYTLCQEID